MDKLLSSISSMSASTKCTALFTGSKLIQWIFLSTLSNNWGHFQNTSPMHQFVFNRECSLSYKEPISWMIAQHVSVPCLIFSCPLCMSISEHDVLSWRKNHFLLKQILGVFITCSKTTCTSKFQFFLNNCEVGILLISDSM